MLKHLAKCIVCKCMTTAILNCLRYFFALMMGAVKITILLWKCIGILDVGTYLQGAICFLWIGQDGKIWEFGCFLGSANGACYFQLIFLLFILKSYHPFETACRESIYILCSYICNIKIGNIFQQLRLYLLSYTLIGISKISHFKVSYFIIYMKICVCVYV